MKETITSIINYVGGRKNIVDVTHCVSRLRITLKNYDVVEDKKIKALNGVMGTAFSANQYQVVFGPIVVDAYDEFCKQIQTNSTSAPQKPKQKFSVKNIIGLFAETISSIFAQAVVPIIGCGLITGLHIALKSAGIILEGSDLDTYLSVLSNAALYFLPFLLAASAAKRFKCNMFMSIAIAGVMMHPTLSGLMQEGVANLVMGPITINLIDYSSTSIPIILSVYMLSKVEHLLGKKLPKLAYSVLGPFLEILIVSPIALIIIGPIGAAITNGLGDIILRMYGSSSILTMAVLSAIYPLFVITGTNMAFIPIALAEMATTGMMTSGAIIAVANMGLACASLAVLIKSKNIRTRSLAATGAVITAIGVTEPALYGVCLPLKRPLIYSMISGCIGGVIAGIFKVYAVGIGAAPFGALPIFFGPTFPYFLLSIGVTGGIAFALTYILGFDENLLVEASGEEPQPAPAPEKGQFSKKKVVLYSPLIGKVVNITDVKNKVYSTEMLGKGLAIIPKEGAVYAPFDGEVIRLLKTKHAIGLKAVNGMEFLIHIGIDTVKLDGKGFTAFVKEGDRIIKGQKLMEFDLKTMLASEYDMTSPVIITKYDEGNSIELTDEAYVDNMSKLATFAMGGN